MPRLQPRGNGDVKRTAAGAALADDIVLLTDSHALITVEEHSISGGLGESCAAVLMQAGISVPFRIVGFPGEYMVTGSQSEIFDHYGISVQGLVRTVKDLLNY